MFRDQSRIHHWKLKAQELFGMDLRSLAIFRISIALIIIVDLIARASDLESHYTDRGVLPIDRVIEHSPKWRVSVHLLNGSIEFPSHFIHHCRVIRGRVAFRLPYPFCDTYRLVPDNFLEFSKLATDAGRRLYTMSIALLEHVFTAWSALLY